MKKTGFITSFINYAFAFDFLVAFDLLWFLLFLKNTQVFWVTFLLCKAFKSGSGLNLCFSIVTLMPYR
jgi:hypothetical protein